MANLRERDEREQLITGRAARAAYISTLSLLVLLLFLSIFSLKVYRVPQSEAIHGKTGTVAIDLNFELLDQPRRELTKDANHVYFETKDLPLSKTGLLLILLLWQLVAFNLTARKENLRDLA